MPISKLKSYFANKYLSFSMTFPLRFKRTQNAFSYAVFKTRTQKINKQYSDAKVFAL